MITFGNRFSSNRGIALGPILFIIAILAILAAAIAAGGTSFMGGRSRESAKIMASTILSNMKMIDNCADIVRTKGYNENQLDLEVPAGMFLDPGEGGDWSWPTSPPASCTNDECGVFKASGGGCIPSGLAAIPQDAIDQSALDSWGNCPVGNNIGCRENYPALVQFQSEGANSPIHLVFGLEPPIRQDVCMEINNQVGIANVGGDAPHGTYSTAYNSVGDYDASTFTGWSFLYDSTQTFAHGRDFCYYDDTWKEYIYVHVLN